MTLYFIGLGLFDENDISLKGFEMVKRCQRAYLDGYTGVLSCGTETLEKLYGKEIILASRDLVENHAEETIINEAQDKDVAFLVVGDPMAATTHLDLRMRAEGAGVKCVVVNSSSIVSAVGITGLQLYKFGKITSIPFPEKEWKPETPYVVIKGNLKAGLHTLVLLDLRPAEHRFMTVNEAIAYLLDIEGMKREGIFTKETLCIGCARLGSLEPCIKAGSAGELLTQDFGGPVHCLVVPATLHFAEEEALGMFSIHK